MQMKNCNKMKLAAAALFVLSFIAAGTVSAEQKLSIKMGGTIEHIDTKHKEISMRDTVEKYSDNVRVMASSGRLLGGASFLKPGQSIAYRKLKSGKRTDPGIIVEIWISGQ